MVQDCPSTRRHGTIVAYCQDRCRCPQARRAHTIYEQRRLLDRMAGRPRTVDAIGTVRRLHALYARGWNAAALSPHLGLCTGRVQALSRFNRRLNSRTADNVKRVYNLLSDRDGPSPYTAGQARARGYAPPIAWDDDTIEDPKAQPYAGIRGPIERRCGGCHRIIHAPHWYCERSECRKRAA